MGLRRAQGNQLGLCRRQVDRLPARPIRPPRRSIRRRANERDGAPGRIVAAGNDAARGGEAAGDVGAAVRRGDPALAIRLAVLSALPVSVADRRVLALPRDLLRRLDVRRCAGDHPAHPGRACRRLHRRRRAGAVDGALARGRQFPVADPDAVPGHSGAVLGGVRHHLVSRRRVPHLLHHGDDDAAGLHVSGARRVARRCRRT